MSLAEVKRLWPGKVKGTFAGIVSRHATMTANDNGTVTLTLALDDGPELTVQLKPDKPGELAKAFEAAAKALSR